MDADALTPFVTWGTNPGQGLPLSAVGAGPGVDRRRQRAQRGRAGAGIHGPDGRHAAARRSTWTPCFSAPAPTAGSRTCGPPRTSCAAGTSIPTLRMLVVPGSMRVKAQAEAEGLDEMFTAAGAEWRSAGCSMCLGMNPDQLAPGERSASTSNRNFEGRQGKGGRTHLVSPLVAAATAVRGTLSSPADLEPIAPGRLTLSARGSNAGPHRRPVGRPLPHRSPHSSAQETTMDAFHTHTGVGIPLRRSNVDTDQIIPAVYLKRITRTGFEDGLFAAWRADPTFVLNHPVFRPARCWSPAPTSARDPRGSTRSGR